MTTGTGGFGIPVEKGGMFRHVAFAEQSGQEFGNRLTAILAAAAVQGYPVLHLSTGVGVVTEGEGPKHWAHLVLYQPPMPPSIDTPGANEKTTEPVALSLVKMTAAPSA